ncbi:unnamed protein product [Clonostachys rosea]|uniref:Zn(2)-C6 fungal-type domain-containing protein n=1 Tax=Bionectria ochroleuca TaxID=29856 RepID=A0ABY6TZ77_BIOOC|nr:unnamed protein product [Clonostachys rosea]
MPPTTPHSPRAKRKHQTPGPAENSRSKRAKYAPVACNECKKSKLKCIKAEYEDACQRCRRNHLDCLFARNPLQNKTPTSEPSVDSITTNHQRTQPSEHDFNVLTKVVTNLQSQISTLSNTLQDLERRLSTYRPRSVVPYHGPSPTFTDDQTVQPPEPREPSFVGPTRSAFSLRMAEASLHRMGIDTEARTPSSSPAASPKPTLPSDKESEKPELCISETNSLLGFELGDVMRLLDDYCDEVESVYPFTQISEISAKAPYILEQARRSQHPAIPAPTLLTGPWPEIESKDVHILKLALAVAIALEAGGQTSVSKRLLDEVEPVICRVSGEAEIDLKELQIMTMLGIYWFHCGEELLAWRAIGISTRETLELGLHRRPILFEHYPDLKERDLAIRLFWCVYILDRQWSFGTSLSFGLVDKDIDSELPEPSEDFPFLRCMAAFARLSGRLWEAFPPSGGSSQVIPKDTVSLIDFMTQNWINSIPQDLRLRHPRLGLAPSHQPRSLHRSRALLYLHGNHLRKLIYRHHIISTASIRADIHSARLVVGIAQDSIEVLVHLHKNSDVYARQQNGFNFFLLSSVASILLAVCNAPDVFAQQCRESFVVAVDLLKGLSRQHSASRILWKSIRRLLPGVKSVGLRADAEAGKDSTLNAAKQAQAHDPLEKPSQEQEHDHAVDQLAVAVNGGVDEGPSDNLWPIQSDIAEAGNSPTDAFDFGEGLVDLFDAFGQMNPDGSANSDFPSDLFNLGGQSMSYGESEEFLRRLHGVI